jgi:periplasmic protein TonB
MSASAAPAGLIRSLAGERALFWCLLASIALHALVLFALSWGGAPAPPARALLVLTARLAPFSAAPRAPAQPSPPKLAPAPPSEPASAPRPALRKPAVTPAPQKMAPAEPIKAQQPESAPAASDAAASPVPSGAPAQTKPAPQAPAGTPTAGATAKSGNEADAGTLEQYRLALIVATRRYKRYPAIAMEKGWQGRVEVHMVIGANGMLASASIKTGSGHDILDNQALDMLKKGKTTVPIPASLRGREFSIDVPVIFNLDNPSS